MPASRKRTTSARKSSSSKRTSIRRYIEKGGPFRQLNHFVSDLGDMEPGIVPTGTGELDIGFVRKGTKKASLSDIMFGNGPSRKLTEIEKYKAALAEHGPGNELMEDGRIKCLTDEYRNISGHCKPKPAMGADQYNAMNRTNVWIQRPGPFGGMENVVRVTQPDGRQVSRIAESTSAGNLYNMILNPGSEKSDTFYDNNGILRRFAPTRYSKTWRVGNGPDQPLPPGYITGPNYIGEDGTTQYGDVYRENDYGRMNANKLKWGSIGQGNNYRAVAAPQIYGNGRSMQPGVPRANMPNFTLNSMMGIPDFPPKPTPQPDPNVPNLADLLAMGQRAPGVRAGSTFRSIGSRW